MMIVFANMRTARLRLALVPSQRFDSAPHGGSRPSGDPGMGYREVPDTWPSRTERRRRSGTHGGRTNDASGAYPGSHAALPKISSPAPDLLRGDLKAQWQPVGKAKRVRATELPPKIGPSEMSGPPDMLRRTACAEGSTRKSAEVIGVLEEAEAGKTVKEICMSERRARS